MSCPPLNNTNNGIFFNCSLGDDGVPSYEDTCNLSCNASYELTVIGTRTCQSNGKWSSNEIYDRCEGKYLIMYIRIIF